MDTSLMSSNQIVVDGQVADHYDSETNYNEWFQVELPEDTLVPAIKILVTTVR